MLFTRLVGGVYGPTVSTIVMTLLVLTFGEITPKSMAKEMPETLAMGFAPRAKCAGYDFHTAERPVRCVEKVPCQTV